MMMSVRPPPAPDFRDGSDLSSSELSVPDDPEEVNLKDALLSDPIVGLEKTILDEHGPGAREPSPLPSPRSMTAAQKAIHDLTHLPYDPACPICLCTHGPNSGHYLSHEDLRVIPLLVADYCFMRFSEDTELQTVPAMRLYHVRVLFRA